MGPIGVFGGTFDPIHYGHLRTALELLRGLGLEQVRFVPCGSPPHRSAPHAAADLRLAMVSAACAGQAGFAVDDRELRRGGPSYTVDTLSALKAEQPRRPLCLILGMDAFLGLPAWHRWQEILRLAHVVVAHRPGWEAPRHGVLGDLLAGSETRRPADLRERDAGSLLVHEVTQLEISSTKLRDIVSRGGDPRYLMPDEVRNIILSSGCYAAKESVIDVE